MDTTGTITSFTSTPNSILDIGGDSYRVETAGQSYSLTAPDPQTLRFEIRPGDQWTYDAGNPVDRAEVDGSADRSAVIPVGTPINLNYQFMLEPNGPNGSFTNTASWFVAGQMQSAYWITGESGSPPFAIQLAGDHLQVVARYVSPGGNPSNGSPDLHMLTLWTDPNPIQTGQYNNISIQTNVSNTGGGYLHVSINGSQVVNYNGPLGFGEPTYWEQGLYRSSTSETVAADYRNLTLTTGSGALTAPTVPPATPSSTAPADSSSTTPAASSSTTPAASSSTTPATPSSTTPAASSSTAPATPSSIAPVLTVADPTLSVTGRGGTVALGVNVTTTDPNDAVTVNITGLPKYETITDKLDGQTFSGNSVTLTAAQVDSGLVLQSNYRGGGHPVAALALTATGKDPSTGSATTSASQTITVTDPRGAAGTTTTMPQTTTATKPTHATDAITASPVAKGFAWRGPHEDHAASTLATTEPGSINNPPPTMIRSLANQGFALLQQHLDGGTGAVPTSMSQTVQETNSPSDTGKAMASQASQCFALLNQYMAGNTGRVDPGQIATAVSQGASWAHDTLLTRPQH